MVQKKNHQNNVVASTSTALISENLRLPTWFPSSILMLLLMPKSINTKSDVNAGHNYIICTKIYNYAPLKKCFPPYKISEKNLVIYAFWQKIQKLKKKRKYFGEKEKKKMFWR